MKDNSSSDATLPLMQNSPISPTQDSISQNSPFGFLSGYADTQATQTAFSAYGGFSEIQRIYKSLGVRWDRGSGMMGGISWGLFDQDMNYREQFSRYVSTARDNKINLLVTIGPGYSQTEPDFRLPTRLAAYRQFVASLVQTYPSVKHWQIHNEVNGGIFWKDTPQNYAVLVKETSNAIRANCPDCTIVLGSSINIDANANTQPISDYFDPVMRELIKDGAAGKPYFDVFDYHFFAPRGSRPDSYHQLIGPQIAAVRSLLDYYGMNHVKIWITETMLPTIEGMSQAELQTLPVEYQMTNEILQASALLKVYVTALANGVKKVFWNKLTEGNWFNFMFDRCGLIRHPNFSGSKNKKLAYFTYKLMIEKLEGSDWDATQTIQESNGINVYKFGKPIWVAWADSGSSGRILLPVDSAAVLVTKVIPQVASGKDIIDEASAFSTEIITATGGIASVPITDSPVFIERH